MNKLSNDFSYVIWNEMERPYKLFSLTVPVNDPVECVSRETTYWVRKLTKFIGWNKEENLLLCIWFLGFFKINIYDISLEALFSFLD